MGGYAATGRASRYNYTKKATFLCIFCCVVASCGGLLYGYDLGVGGGIISMDDFQATYFPEIYEQEKGFKQVSPYCKFNSQTVQLFQSSLYIAGFLASLAASYLAKVRGRKLCMMLAGICYVIGVGLTAGAVPRESGLGMLICGRLMLGVGVGFANSTVTIYSSEMSPPAYRGLLSVMFQFCSTVGILIAQLIDYGVLDMEKNGWRIPMAIAGVPAIMILLGGIFLPETPSSLISRDHYDKGRKVLRKIRGEEDIEAEFEDIFTETRQDKQIKHPLLAFFRPCYRGQLVISVVISIVHQMSGNNAMVQYSPLLFASMGAGKKGSLLNTVILAAVKVISTVVAMVTVDRFGRRSLLIFGGAFMVTSEIIIGVLLGIYFSRYGSILPKHIADGVLAVMCIFLANYEWSWGPLGWLIPAEIQASEIRTAGMGVANATSMLFSFVVGQTFLTMMCSMRYWTFIFFAIVVACGVLFAILLLPECKQLHIEEVHKKFTEHWFWGRYPSPPRASLPVIETATPKDNTELNKPTGTTETTETTEKK